MKSFVVLELDQTAELQVELQKPVYSCCMSVLYEGRPAPPLHGL